MARDDGHRPRILERRARFLAAAVVGVATFDAACDARACLEVAPQCDVDPAGRYVVEGPTTLCVGQRVDVRYVNLYCGQRSDATRDAKFTSSDPAIVSIEGAFVRANAAGRVTIRGIFADDSGEPATLVIDVTSCADASEDG